MQLEEYLFIGHYLVHGLLIFLSCLFFYKYLQIKSKFNLLTDENNELKSSNRYLKMNLTVMMRHHD